MSGASSPPMRNLEREDHLTMKITLHVTLGQVRSQGFRVTTNVKRCLLRVYASSLIARPRRQSNDWGTDDTCIAAQFADFLYTIFKKISFSYFSLLTRARLRTSTIHIIIYYRSLHIHVIPSALFPSLPIFYSYKYLYCSFTNAPLNNTDLFERCIMLFFLAKLERLCIF